MMPTTPTQAGVLPPADLVSRARAHVEAHGLGAAARDWEVSRAALTQFLAGLRVRRGTVALIASGLHGRAPAVTAA